MGKGPKHSSSKPRNNGIFKVAGQNFKVKDKKGKPKEVTSKLKLVREGFIKKKKFREFSLSSEGPPPSIIRENIFFCFFIYGVCKVF